MHADCRRSCKEKEEEKGKKEEGDHVMSGQMKLN